jgi:hypothetical protein
MPHQGTSRVYVYEAERFDAGGDAIREKPGELESFVPVTDHSLIASIMPYRQRQTFTNLPLNM